MALSERYSPAVLPPAHIRVPFRPETNSPSALTQRLELGSHRCHRRQARLSGARERSRVTTSPESSEGPRREPHRPKVCQPLSAAGWLRVTRPSVCPAALLRLGDNKLQSARRGRTQRVNEAATEVDTALTGRPQTATRDHERCRECGTERGPVTAEIWQHAGATHKGPAGVRSRARHSGGAQSETRPSSVHMRATWRDISAVI